MCGKVSAPTSGWIRKLRHFPKNVVAKKSLLPHPVPLETCNPKIFLAMSTPDETQNLQHEEKEMAEIVQRPLGGRLKAYTAKSGPGWLQGAITLGGGSLGGALFLGVLLGYNMMWLQPFAMVLGVIMLSAIAYVTLSTGLRPFTAINNHVSPVLGWAWLIATLMANVVWCLPQFSLGTGAIQQNLLPSLEGSQSAPWVVGAVLLVTATTIIWFYDSGNKGIKIFEIVLKVLVGIVVISFFGVAIKLLAAGALDIGAIFKGLIPNFSYLFKPAPLIQDAINNTGDHAETWTKIVSGMQRDKIITAFGTAVGINMTFLLPYSMLRKGWGKNHRGLAVFDLSIGLIVPFVLATGCIVLAASSQFHAKHNDILNADGSVKEGRANSYNSVADRLVTKASADELKGLKGDALKERKTQLRDGLGQADRRLAAMLVDRKDKDLALSLKELAGEAVGRKIFGIGVFGMALSTIIILMLINGFVLCEMLGRPGDRKIHFIGACIPGIVGIFAPLVWTGDSKAALAIPTSVIGSSLLPIAYFTFMLLMNSKNLLGDAMPTGKRRIIWNILMFIATSVASFASIWALNGRQMFGFPIGSVAISLLVILFVLGLIGFISKSKRHTTS